MLYKKNSTSPVENPITDTTQCALPQCLAYRLPGYSTKLPLYNIEMEGSVRDYFSLILHQWKAVWPWVNQYTSVFFHIFKRLSQIIITILPSSNVSVKMIHQKKKKDKPGFIAANYATTYKCKIKRCKEKEFTRVITYAVSVPTSQYLLILQITCEC